MRCVPRTQRSMQCALLSRGPCGDVPILGPGSAEQRKNAAPRPGHGEMQVPCPSTKPKQFMPLNIAVLTVSDTRTLADDKSGTTLAERLTAAGHTLAAREIVTDDVDAIRVIIKRWIADPGRRCDHHHRRHRLHRPRRDAGGDRAAVRKADGRLLHRLPHAEPRQDRHLDDPEPRHRRRRRRDLHLLPAGIAGRLPRRLGRHPRRRSSITARGPAISSRSCRGSTSICGGRKRKARRPDGLVIPGRAEPSNDRSSRRTMLHQQPHSARHMSRQASSRSCLRSLHVERRCVPA